MDYCVEMNESILQHLWIRTVIMKEVCDVLVNEYVDAVMFLSLCS